jgi:hypothetical protein
MAHVLVNDMGFDLRFNINILPFSTSIPRRSARKKDAFKSETDLSNRLNRFDGRRLMQDARFIKDHLHETSEKSGETFSFPESKSRKMRRRDASFSEAFVKCFTERRKSDS